MSSTWRLMRLLTGDRLMVSESATGHAPIAHVPSTDPRIALCGARQLIPVLATRDTEACIVCSDLWIGGTS